MASHESYLHYLKSERNREAEAGVVKLLSAYQIFSENIKELLSSSDAQTNTFLGSGKWSQVYCLKQDNQSFAVKIPDPGNERPPQQTVHDKLIAGVIAKNIPCLEQIVAGSHLDGMIVSRYANEHPIESLEPQVKLKLQEWP